MARKQAESDTGLPSWLNRDLLNFVASIREEEVPEYEKFSDFDVNDIDKLISCSDDERFVKDKTHKSYKRKLNGLLKNFAIMTLNNKNFKKDILELARINNLLEVRYKFYSDELCNTFSPAINAWESRLKYLSIFHLSKKLNAYNKKDWKLVIGDLFIETYLPPKFEAKVLALMEKYGLEFFWYESIVHLLLTGHWYLPRNASVIFLNLESENENLGPTSASLSLEIYSMTSKEEISYRWSEVESLQKQFFPKLKARQKIRNLDEFKLKLRNEDKFQDFLHGENDQRSRDAVRKKITRAESAHNEFLESRNKIPPKILSQLLRAEESSLKNIQFF